MTTTNSPPPLIPSSVLNSKFNMSGETGSHSFCLELPAKKKSSRIQGWLLGCWFFFLARLFPDKLVQVDGIILHFMFGFHSTRINKVFFFGKKIPSLYQLTPEFQLSPLIFKWSLLKPLSCHHPPIFSSSIVGWCSFPRFSLLIWLHVSDLSSLPMIPSPTSQKVRISPHLPSLCISAHISYKTVDKEQDILPSGELASVKRRGMAEEV